MSRYHFALLGLIAAALAFGAPPATAATPGRWSGTTTIKTERTDGRLITGGYTAQGDYAFTVLPDGRVRGYAVVAFEPYFDTEQLNAAVSFIHTSVSSGLGILGGFAGAAASIGASTIVGVSDSYDHPMEVHEGPIAGSMRGGRLSLDWAGKKPKSVPFHVDFSVIGGSQRVTSAAIPVATAWPGEARVHGDIAVRRTQSAPKKGNAENKTSGFWFARRLGR